MYKVRISEQVESFVRVLPPDVKRAMRDAMGKLAKQQGDIRALEDELEGFSRLRVGKYRIIFTYAENKAIDCLFVESRKLVYEIFGALLKEQIEERGNEGGGNE